MQNPSLVKLSSALLVSIAFIACGPMEQPSDGSVAMDTGVGNPPTDSGVGPAMDSGVGPQADTGIGTPRVDSGVAPRVDSGVSNPPADSGVTLPPGTPPGNPMLEQQVLDIVNMHRARGYNCGGQMFAATGPLTMHPLLVLAARRHSLDMGTRNYFAHNAPEGTTPFQRTAAAGYTGSPQGENIAAGSATAAATMTQWMNSPGHCRNIMNPSYRTIGVGYANVPSSRFRHYWTQNFGGR
jgi:uncharacterized protein YkwD